MNMIALQWLRKIDIKLIDIIRTEYSTELKSGVQLAKLVPDISPNIDSLLSRYSSSSVHKIAMDEDDDEDNDDESGGEAEVRFNQQTPRNKGRGHL